MGPTNSQDDKSYIQSTVIEICTIISKWKLIKLINDN